MLITVRLVKPLKNATITYTAELVECTERYVLLHARWTKRPIDLDVMTLVPGDHLYEHFYSDRWYNVYEVYAEDGGLKGWYCNVTRPAVFEPSVVVSEDLELDLLVSPERDRILTLDEDEFAARELHIHDAAAHREALAALETLRVLAMRGEGPFAYRRERV